MNVAFILAQILTQVPREPGSLRFTVDVAQTLAVCGLVWKLSTMSSAVDRLTEEMGKMILAMATIGTRLTVLETRDEARRDRRHDDAHG